VTSSSHPPSSLLSGLSSVATDYDVILCDIWGVLHNGIVGYQNAADALMRFRHKGGRVILVSNAPRPAHDIVGILDKFSVNREAYDGIVTSGDVTRTMLFDGPWSSYCWLGPERDAGLFENIPLPRADLDHAEILVCTGLNDDDNETAETYRAYVTKARERDIPMLCANPDIVVERGHRLIDCAGAIAKIYEEIGGTTFYAGKPHAPIYAAALDVAASLTGKTPSRARTLAIGDALRTDIAGANAAGIGSLFVLKGIHIHELGLADAPLDADRLTRFLDHAAHRPDHAIPELVW